MIIDEKVILSSPDPKALQFLRRHFLCSACDDNEIHLQIMAEARSIQIQDDSKLEQWRSTMKTLARVFTVMAVALMVFAAPVVSHEDELICYPFICEADL